LLKIRKREFRIRRARELKRAKRLFKSTPQHFHTVKFLKNHHKTLSKYSSEEGVEPITPSKLPKIYKQSGMRILAAYKK
jgi:hypothetical protein